MAKKADEVDALAAAFKQACSIGTGQAKKDTLTSANLTKWFKQRKMYGKNLTSNDTDIAFNVVKTKGKKEITLEELKTLITRDDIVSKYQKDKKIKDKAEAIEKLKSHLNEGVDGSAGATTQSSTGGVGRLTDTSGYTGSHKERFDESGKGKGLEGREDRADNSGYVGNYKGEGTYDKK